jgi:predicted RNA-binding Zn ribbon-like protein
MSDNAEFFARTPARRELPAGFDVRTDLYINGSGFGSAAANLRSGGKARISAALIGLKTTTSNAAWQQLARDGQIFESPSEGSYRSPAQIRAMSDSAIRSLVNRQDYDVDHTQPLARHWVNTGYNSADAVRHRVAGSPSNLKLMLAFYNRQAGAAATTTPTSSGLVRTSVRPITQACPGLARSRAWILSSGEFGRDLAKRYGQCGTWFPDRSAGAFTGWCTGAGGCA